MKNPDVSQFIEFKKTRTPIYKQIVACQFNCSHYEESLRIPLLIYDPRKPKEEAGKVSDKMVLNIDIPATMLDYAGVSVPSLYQGNSLLPIVNNEPTNEWRNSFFCEHRFDNPKIPKYRGIRGERYVYANYYEQSPAYEYLHDLEKDPSQLVNLVDDNEYNEVLKEMRLQALTMESKIKE